MKLNHYIQLHDSKDVARPHGCGSKALPEQVVRAKIESAAQKSVSRQHGILDAWADAYRACSEKKIPFEDALCWRDREGKVLLQTIVEHGDAFSVRLLHSSIPDGTYADGNIVRTPDSLHKVVDANGTKYGYLRQKSDNLYSGYVGHFVGEKRHGWGRFDYRQDDYYEGNWKDNEKSGYGRYTQLKGSKPFSYEVVFEGGDIPRIINEKKSIAKLDFFKRVRKMIVPM